MPPYYTRIRKKAIIYSSKNKQPKLLPRGMLSTSLGPPHEEVLAPVDLLLQLEKSVEKGLGSWGASRNIYVNWNNPIAPSNDRV